MLGELVVFGASPPPAKISRCVRRTIPPWSAHGCAEPDAVRARKFVVDAWPAYGASRSDVVRVQSSLEHFVVADSVPLLLVMHSNGHKATPFVTLNDGASDFVDRESPVLPGHQVADAGQGLSVLQLFVHPLHHPGKAKELLCVFVHLLCFMQQLESCRAVQNR